MKAYEVISMMEEISSNLARVEQTLQKDDKVIAQVLRKLIARIFWSIEKPIIEAQPSLRALAIVGEKYKKCTFKIISYDHELKKYNVIKTGISAEKLEYILATVKNQDLSVKHEIEFCPPLQDDISDETLEKEHHDLTGKSIWPEWQYQCKIDSKAKAALILNELEKIYSNIGKTACLQKENKEIVEVLANTMGDILTDIYYPILRVYPSLLPVGLIEEEKHKGCTYSMIEHNWDSGTSLVKISNIPPEHAKEALENAEKNFSCTKNSFLYLELNVKCEGHKCS